MPTKRNKAVPAVYLILKRGGKILLLRRQGSGYYDGWYSLPAGHVEAKELPIAGLVRESVEELGITIKPQDVQLVHAMYRAQHDETGERLDLFFAAAKWSGEIVNVEPDKCGELCWCPLANLPDKTVPYVREAIRNAEAGIIYSELFKKE